MADEPLGPRQFGTAFKRFMDAVVAEAEPPKSPLFERLRDHLGGDPTRMPVIAEEFDHFEQPNVQVALDAYVAREGRRAELVGIAAQNKRFMGFSLSDLLSRGGIGGWPGLAEGPVDYVNFHLEQDRLLACVQFGLYLISAGPARIGAFIVGPSDQMGPRRQLRLEVIAAEQAHAQEFLRELAAAMRERNVYRGKVISLAPGQMGVQALVKFHRLPAVARNDVILPPGLLERIERHAIAFSDRAKPLLAAHRSLKRGMLLYGAPGTGKTLTVMYLAGRMGERTVLLTTGRGLGMVQSIGQLARLLQPSTVVMEDVDLVAQERGLPGVQTGPLLFELLNEMDGLSEDSDVLFVLTTNRPDILEPALAARPGRIDLAVELPLPDAEGRRRLLALYARGLTLADVDSERFVERTEGASPAYVKELLRKAALLAAIEGDGGAIEVSGRHLEGAMDELSQGGDLGRRILGAATGETEAPPPGPVRPVGFPQRVR
ncbi:MAG: AAA family ATPase [Candidatus Limnocylindria bacterium]